MQVVRPNGSVVGPHVMLALVISKIFYSGVPFEFVHIQGHIVSHPKNIISIDPDRWRLTVSCWAKQCCLSRDVKSAWHRVGARGVHLSCLNSGIM